jgi:acyl-CoA reductase-like NAD-dependent aldehyde dehydrogenase
MGGGPVEIYGTGKYAFLPTIVRDCSKEMKILQEENFGPVFPVLSFSTEADLLSKIDDSDYGLNASFYGSCPPDIKTYLENSHRNVYFNSTVSSPCNLHSRLLDGGYKNSGLVWEWEGKNFLQREGRRLLLKELSANAPCATGNFLRCPRIPVKQ